MPAEALRATLVGVTSALPRDTMLSRLRCAVHHRRCSTGIYCLPSCRARKPVEFYPLPDVSPAGDRALATALRQLHHLKDAPDTARVEQLMSASKPHRSLATVHLWHSLHHHEHP